MPFRFAYYKSEHSYHYVSFVLLIPLFVILRFAQDDKQWGWICLDSAGER
jgi:hypothetical protein